VVSVYLIRRFMTQNPNKPNTNPNKPTSTPQQTKPTGGSSSTKKPGGCC